MIVSNPTEYSCALYCRLSNEDDLQGESQSITNQKELLNRYATENNLKIFDVYIDDGYSGTNFDRPDFKRMIKDIENKKVNMVIVKDTSRLGRDYIKTGEYLEKYFPQNQIRVVSILDNYDSLVDNGAEDMLPMKYVMNDMYAKETSKKIRSIKQSRAKAGLFVGRFAPFGYEKSKEDKHKLVVNKECAEIVKQIFDLFLQGNSPLQISYILKEKGIPTPSQIMSKTNNINIVSKTNCWHAEVIRRILQNEMYIGNLVSCRKKKVNYKLKKTIDTPKESWIIVPNTHEPIIEKEKFYMVQEILNSRKTTRTKTHDFLLKGLVECKECGKKMGLTIDSKGNHTKYLRCTTYATAPKHRLCTPHIINYQKLEELVLSNIQEVCKAYLDKNKIKEIINTKEQQQKEQTKILKEKSITEKAIALLNIQIDRIYEDRLKDLISEVDFQRMYENKLKERKKQEERLKQLNNVTFEKEVIDYDKIIDEFLKKENTTKYMLTSLVEKIQIDDNKNVTIHYKFSMLNEIK